MVKNPPANAGDARDLGSTPGSGRSPGEGNGNPLQYSCLENPVDRGAWWAAVCGVAQSRTWLKRLSSSSQYFCLKNSMDRGASWATVWVTKRHNWATNTHISQFSSLSHVQLFPTPWTAASQASLSITNSWRLLKFMSIELVMPSNHLILCHPLLLPSIFPSRRVFSNEQFFASGGQRIGISA